MTADIQARHAHLDGLVNNAGIFPGSPLEATELSDWNHLLATNLTVDPAKPEAAEQIKKAGEDVEVGLFLYNASAETNHGTVVGQSETLSMLRAYGPMDGPKTAPTFIVDGTLKRLENGSTWIADDIVEQVQKLSALPFAQRATTAAQMAAQLKVKAKRLSRRAPGQSHERVSQVSHSSASPACGS